MSNGIADVPGFYRALGVDLGRTRGTEATVRCFIAPDAHSHDDKAKSCRVSLEHGSFRCHACGAKGGAYDAALTLGRGKRETMDLLRQFALTDAPPPAKSTPPSRQKPAGKKPEAKAKPAAKADANGGGLAATETEVTGWCQRLLADERALARIGELRGWQRDALERLSVGFDGERYTLPVRDATGSLVALCRYQPDPELRDATNGRPKMKADQHSHRELFPAPESYPLEAMLLLVEGEVDVPLAVSLGVEAVGYPGLQGWRPEWSDRFQGRKVCLIPDASEKGRLKAREVAQDLYGKAAEVRLLDLFEAERCDDADLTDWLTESGALSNGEPTRKDAAKLLRKMAAKAPRLKRGSTGTARSMSLAQVVASYRRWLWLPDTRPLLAVLGAAAANYLEGDPVWLLLVGASGSGKTQIVEPLRRLPAVHSIATLTEGALLSGTSRSDRSEDATGGLLREMGEFGVLMFKDFTSVLSMDPHARDRVLSALREIYDGHYTRPLGTDGGRKLYWPSKDGPKGKIGVLGGVTDAIDQKQSVSGAMGERLLLFRLARQDPLTMSLAALKQGTENQRRDEELEEAVCHLFAYGPPREPESISDDEQVQLAALAVLTAYCRSGVQRDRISREVDDVNEPEIPTRLSRALQQLLLGLSSIGVGRRQAFAIVAKVAIDSVPGIRSAVLAELLKIGDATVTTTEVASALHRTDAKAVRRALEDLELHGVVEGVHGGQGVPTAWRTHPWIRPFAQLTQSYGEGSGKPAGNLQESLLKAIRLVQTPQNPLEQAVSGSLGSEWSDSFPASVERKGSSKRSIPPLGTPPSISSYAQGQDAGKVPLSAPKPLGPKGYEPPMPVDNGFREVSSETVSEPPIAFIEQEGWKLPDEKLVAELGARFGVPEEDSFALVDLAYDVRRAQGA